MLYTRNGDNGTTRLIDSKGCIPKESPVFDALGSLDELNSLLGICRSHSKEGPSHLEIEKEIITIQECLFIIQAELAGADKTLSPTHIEDMENVIAKVEKCITAPSSFVIPGATPLSALFDYARSVSRRVERVVLEVSKSRPTSPSTRIYLNRLSSMLYVLARLAAQSSATPEISPSY